MHLQTLVTVVSLAVGALAPPGAGARQLTCEPQSSPLLEVTYYRPQTFDVRLPVYEPEVRGAWLLCKDRRLLGWSISSQVPEPPDFSPVPPTLPYKEARVSADIVTPDAFSTLQAAMGAAHIGVLSDCVVELDPRFFATGLEITWHGRGGRRNTFFFNAGNASSPCSSAAADLAMILALVPLGTEPGGSSVVIQ